MVGGGNETLVAVGERKYASTVKSVVHLGEREFAPGSGDPFDPPEVREDRERRFYFLKYAETRDPSRFVSESGAFVSIGDAKREASRMCPGIEWIPDD